MQLDNVLNPKSTHETCPVPVSLLKMGKYDISQSVTKIDVTRGGESFTTKEELNQCMTLE